MKSSKTENLAKTPIRTPELRMMNDRVLVVPSNEEGERATRGGLLIPATANDDRRLRWGEVVSIGRNAHIYYCAREISKLFLKAMKRQSQVFIYKITLIR